MRGVHKQIVVLNEFENPLFEQAIFILKADASKNSYKSSDTVLKEARNIVNGYIKKNCQTVGFDMGRHKTAVITKVKKRVLQKVLIAVGSISLLAVIAYFWLFF